MVNGLFRKPGREVYLVLTFLIIIPEVYRKYTRSIPEVYRKYTRSIPEVYRKVNYRTLPICDKQDELANVVIYKQRYYMLYPVQRPKVSPKCVHKQQE
jgi:hypothetical protein